MAFPQSLDEMKSADYKFSGDGVCRGCGQDIEWWETPRGKKLPMDPMKQGSTPAVPHWQTCSEGESFRRKRD